MAKRIKKVRVDGKKYPVVEEIPGKKLIVMTTDGEREAFPRYIGWTIIGFSFRFFVFVIGFLIIDA
jgi:hypothetical protein